MIVTAHARHLPHPPRKLQLVTKPIVGKKATLALTSLEFTPKLAAPAVIKVLKQALANAKNNFKLDPNSLYLKQAFVTKGRALKRPRFAGRGHRRLYQKTTAHLTVKLAQEIKTPEKNQPQLTTKPVTAANTKSTTNK